MMNSSNISPNIARQILMEAKKNGVSVGDYLNEAAKEKPNNRNGGLPRVRRTKTSVDFSGEHKWLKENRLKILANGLFWMEINLSEQVMIRSRFFRASIFIEKLFSRAFYAEMVEEAREVITKHGLLFNYDGWANLIAKHKVGENSQLRTLYENSELLIDDNLEAIRKRTII